VIKCIECIEKMYRKCIDVKKKMYVIFFFLNNILVYNVPRLLKDGGK